MHLCIFFHCGKYLICSHQFNHTVLCCPQAAHRELPTAPRGGKSPEINTAVPAADGEGEKSQPSSSYPPSPQRNVARTQNWGTPHTAMQPPWGKARLWSPATSSAPERRALLSLPAVTPTVGSPLLCSSLSVQVPHRLPPVSSLVGVFCPFLISLLSLSVFSPFTHFPLSFPPLFFPPSSVLPQPPHPLPNITPRHTFSPELLCRKG